MIDPSEPLPKIGGPATGALHAAGVDTLAAAAALTEAELLAMHGIGPKAVRILREHLAGRGVELGRD